MKDEELKSYIQIVNRESGDIELLIKHKKQYVKVYSQIISMPDVQNSIKVWKDVTGKSRKELLKEFSLVELINCMSTKYFARVIKRKEQNA